MASAGIRSECKCLVALDVFCCSTQCASVVPTVVNSVLVWFLHTVVLYTLFGTLFTVQYATQCDHCLQDVECTDVDSDVNTPNTISQYHCDIVHTVQSGRCAQFTVYQEQIYCNGAQHLQCIVVRMWSAQSLV